MKPYATHHQNTRGRLYDEPESTSRSPFQRDKDRIIHSGAFRKLKHKTQVFVYHEGDYYRTRLTHSLEVAQVARTISRALELDEDLAEALALAHDMGHPPFGHAGENALHEMMLDYDGFDHNDNGLRIVTQLERRYAEFDGINLTWETLEGLVKHNGPLITDDKEIDSLPVTLRDFHKVWDLEYHTHAGPEAQVAALSDDIAYNNHDLDDGLRAGLFTLDDLKDLPLIGDFIKHVDQKYPNLTPSRRRHESIRRMYGALVEDLLSESQKRLDKLAPKSAEDIRNHTAPVIAFSEEMQGYDKQLRKFLWDHMYMHYTQARMYDKAERIIYGLFDLFHEKPACLPTDWQNRGDLEDEMIRARVIADYISGMTDRYALDEYRRLFDMDARTA